MSEDDLRNFPMATTDYLQRIRATQRYQDIIAVHALFEAIQRVILEPGFFWVPLDWLKYRLCVDIFDLTQREWCTRNVWYQKGRVPLVQFMGDRDGVINIKSVHGITPGQSPGRSILIDLVRCLRRLADFKNVFSLPYQERVKYLGREPQVLVRDSEDSGARYLVKFTAVTRMPSPEVPYLEKLDCLSPPAPAAPSEEYSVNAIGKVSAISSSKQQPLPAVLDELFHRRGTEDA